LEAGLVKKFMGFSCLLLIFTGIGYKYFWNFIKKKSLSLISFLRYPIQCLLEFAHTTENILIFDLLLVILLDD